MLAVGPSSSRVTLPPSHPEPRTPKTRDPSNMAGWKPSQISGMKFSDEEVKRCVFLPERLVGESNRVMIVPILLDSRVENGLM